MPAPNPPRPAVRGGPPRELSGFCLDCFLLARFAAPGEGGRPEGRAWEQAVAGLLWRPGLTRHQAAGTLGLFGLGSASGAGHELDGAGHGPHCGVWVEAKARETLHKSELAVFDLKCFDFYKAAARRHPQATRDGSWWPVLVSSEPAPEAVRRLCMTLGVVLCDPQRMPLPVLLAAAAQPEADLYLPDTMLAEAVRLFEVSCRAMQRRWQITDQRTLCLTLDEDLDAVAVGDALYLQDELTEDLLDYFELEAPGQLETRAGRLARALARLGGWLARTSERV